MIRLLIADDQKLLRESFKYIIENNSDIKVIGCVGDGKEAYEFCSKYNPDIVLMDIAMPVCNGTEAIKLIKANYSHIKVLILTASSNGDDVAEAIYNGADGYIVKDIGTEELILSIKSTAAGLGIIHKKVLKSVPLTKNEPDTLKKKDKSIEIGGIPVALTDTESVLHLIPYVIVNQQIR